uniref:G_PROTEIN_RECEP_F1_2 domain-containing protein n=1 Tax=Steinernema glaseri TaxID=37863 RepID=A0A1I7Z4A1_9BILA
MQITHAEKDYRIQRELLASNHPLSHTELHEGNSPGALGKHILHPIPSDPSSLEVVVPNSKVRVAFRWSLLTLAMQSSFLGFLPGESKNRLPPPAVLLGSPGIAFLRQLFFLDYQQKQLLWAFKRAIKLNMAQRPSGLYLAWMYFFGSLYLVVPIAGVTLNAWVIYRLLRIARANRHRFETTSALPLCAMSFGDSICLLAQLSQAVFHFLTRTPALRAVPAELLALFCKADLFLMHATSAFSVWCWLLLSVLRYIAVFHPLAYRNLWRQPRHALLLMAVSIGLLELWIPATVTYNARHKSCSEASDAFLSKSIQVPFHSGPTSMPLIQAYHLLDIVFSYAVPSCLRLGLDALVLSHCYLRKLSAWWDPSPKKTLLRRSVGSPHTLRRKRAMVVRSALVSAVNLCCNLPSHLLRLLLTLQEEPVSPRSLERHHSSLDAPPAALDRLRRGRLADALLFPVHLQRPLPLLHHLRNGSALPRRVETQRLGPVARLALYKGFIGKSMRFVRGRSRGARGGTPRVAGSAPWRRSPGPETKT